MNPGATNEEISAAESKLSMTFPAAYQEFLLQHNGGSVFWETIIFFGTPQVEQHETFELVNANWQKWPGIPDSYLAIAVYSYGDEVCLVTDKNNNQNYEVIRWDHELGRITKTWPSLEEWLNELIIWGRQLYDYDGSQKGFTLNKILSGLKSLFGANTRK